MTMTLRAAATALLLAPVAAAHAGSDAEQGAAVVAQWCGLCHPAAGAPVKPDMAPPFAEIAARPGRNAEYLTRFLRQDHFPMTIYRLFDDEKSAVVAYILSLR